MGSADVTLYSKRLGQAPGVGKGNKVTIWTTKVEEDWAKDLVDYDIPRSKKTWAQGPEKWIIDMLKVKHVFTVNGHLVANATETDDQVVSNLKKIIEAGGAIILNYRGKDYIGNIVKCKITEEAVDFPATAPENVTRYSVILTFLIGKSRLG